MLERCTCQRTMGPPKQGSSGTKTRWQVVMAAVVANLSLVMGHSRRQAEAAGALSAEAAARFQNGLLGGLLGLWSRLFARSEPAWV